MIQMKAEKKGNKLGNFTLFFCIIVVLIHVPLTTLNNGFEPHLNEYDFYSILLLYIVILLSMLYSLKSYKLDSLTRKIMKSALTIHLLGFAIFILAILLSGGA